MNRKHLASRDEPETQSQRKRVRIEPDNSTQNRASGEGEENNQDSDSEYENDEAEERALQEAAAEMAKRTPKLGAKREAGAIERIELSKIMCHDYFAIEFGPQANFIIGHNGSGKSAILTGIIMGLGGKASTTNRAKSWKDSIKYGATRGEVKLEMSNRGDDAFRADVYGESIIIERAITKDGSSHYKLRSGRDKKIVSTKKDELQAILDHFMIQADNPLNVLNQDDARSFLNASSSREKYRLFIRGTQLQQLTNDYEEINSNIARAELTLDNKSDDLKTLHERAKQAKETLKIVDQAADHAVKLEVLRKELVWAYVAEAEAEKAEAALKVQDEEQVIPQCQAEITRVDTELQVLREKIKTLTAKMSETNDEELDAKRIKLKSMLKERQDASKKYRNDIREQNLIAEKLRRQIDEQNALIEAENRKASNTTDLTRQEALNRREQCEKEIKDKEARQAELKTVIENLKEHVKSSNLRLGDMMKELDRSQRDISAIQDDLNRARRSQTNRISAFGRSAESISRDIDAYRWNSKPIGPLGMHLRCKDKKWATIIDNLLWHDLTAYLVNNKSDEEQLRGILKKNGSRSSIIRSAYDLFEYSHGEPSPDYLTVLRNLTFDNEYVKRALINSARIERTILVEHRRVGDPIMSRRPEDRPNVDRCYTLDGFACGGAGSGKMVTALQLKGGACRLSDDHSAFIAQRTQDLQQKEASRQSLEAARQQLNHEIAPLSNQLRKLEAEQAALRPAIRKLTKLKNEMDDEIVQSASSNLAALETLRADLIMEQTSANAQIKELNDQLTALQRDSDPLLEEIERIKAYFASKKTQEKKLEDEILATSKDELTLKGHLKHYQTSLAKHQGLLDVAKKGFDAAHEKVVTVTGQAVAICRSDQVIQSSKSVKKLMSEMDKHTKVLEATQNRYGKDIDAIRRECNGATAAFLKSRKEFDDLSNLIDTLKYALELRKKKWLDFRAHITLSAKMKFINHLSNRGYTGKLNFDHEGQRLDVQVDTNSEELKQAKMRDSKGLSGGERSFSTISLLLTLWDAVNCPIRCLDEFDVFMDVFHRKVAVKMMIESAKEANEVQYIFITPQDMSSIVFGPETRISRMDDPKRMRGALGVGTR